MKKWFVTFVLRFIIVALFTFLVWLLISGNWRDCSRARQNELEDARENMALAAARVDIAKSDFECAEYTLAFLKKRMDKLQLENSIPEKLKEDAEHNWEQALYARQRSIAVLGYAQIIHDYARLRLDRLER